MPQTRNGPLQTSATNGAGVQACVTNGAGVQPWVVHLHVHLHVRKQNFSSRETGNFGISICLDIFIKPIPRSHKKKNISHGHTCARARARRTCPVSEDVRTLRGLAIGSTTSHAPTHSFARSHARTKRFPGWSHNPTSDISEVGG